MAKITTRRTGLWMRKLFKILIEHPEGMRARDALAMLREQMELTEYEKGDFPSGGKRFDQIIRFATIDCVKAGWMAKDKGIWTVTEEGIRAYHRLTDPEEFYKEAQRLYRQWKRSSQISAPAQEVADDAEEKSVTITYEEAEEQAWQEIETYLKTMSPYDFQKLVAALLKAMGYHVSWISPPGKDGGIDIVAWNDPLGTRPPRIKVQVKREQNATNVSTLRSFMALLGDKDVGLFVSTGGFTKDARREAREQQRRQVALVDMVRLFELWIEHLDKLNEEERSLLPLKPIYFLSPNV